jgi:hypothetical protein
MPGLVPGIHDVAVSAWRGKTKRHLANNTLLSRMALERLGVDGRDKPGHDG